MKKAIVVVSFGTSHEDTRKLTIEAIEDRIAEIYNEYDIFRAFTSKYIIRKLKNDYNMVVQTVEEILEQLVLEGYREVIVQPTHVINGIENDNMLDDIRKYVGYFDLVKVGQPLLANVQDYKELIDCVMKEYPVSEKEALLLMGHGSDHPANAVYPAIDYTFKLEGYNNVYMATIKGYPTLEETLYIMKDGLYDKVELVPFLIVAGDHVKNDMAGDEEDSWKSILINEGYEVHCILKGLGELTEVRDMFIRHIKEAVVFEL